MSEKNIMIENLLKEVKNVEELINKLEKENKELKATLDKERKERIEEKEKFIAAIKSFIPDQKSTASVATEAKEEIKAKEEEKPKEETKQAPKREENLYGNFPYKEDNIYEMTKNELLFAYARIEFKEKGTGLVIDRAEVIAVPLTTKEKYPAVLVWLAHNGETSTCCTEEGMEKNLIACGECNFELVTYMEGKKFRAEIRATENEEYELASIVRVNGYKGHLLLKDEGYEIHISPVTFSNSEDGLANFIYTIIKDGKVISCGDNSEGSVFYENNGVKKEILAKWQENTLYGTSSFAKQQ